MSDLEPEPLFLGFSKTFKKYNLLKLNHEITEFEKTHPSLKLVLAENIDRTIPVHGDYLFSDGNKDFFELKYEFTEYGRVLYYEPKEPELAEWLTMIDEFKVWCKERRAKRDPLRIKQAEATRYLAHKKKVLQNI